MRELHLNRFDSTYLGQTSLASLITITIVTFSWPGQLNKCNGSMQIRMEKARDNKTKEKKVVIQNDNVKEEVRGTEGASAEGLAAAAEAIAAEEIAS